jgi:hypothetical protein
VHHDCERPVALNDAAQAHTIGFDRFEGWFANMNAVNAVNVVKTTKEVSVKANLRVMPELMPTTPHRACCGVVTHS